jgi:hypothetical protein
MGNDADCVGAVAGDAAFELGRARADDLSETTATGRTGDSRKIDVAAQRRANQQQLPWFD